MNAEVQPVARLLLKSGRQSLTGNLVARTLANRWFTAGLMACLLGGIGPQLALLWAAPPPTASDQASGSPGDAESGKAAGSLWVETVPPGAAIFDAGGRDFGKHSPALLTGLPVGSIELELVLDGYAPAHVRAEVFEKKMVTVSAALARRGALRWPGLDYLGTNAQGYDEYRNVKDDSVMVHVPAGAFKIGLDEAARKQANEEVGLAYSPANPPNTYRQVVLDDYLMDKLEITVGRYRAFASQSGQALSTWWKSDSCFSNPQFPVSRVSWVEARAYAEWAGKELPTEAQWEKGARGTEGRQFPWGDEWDPSLTNSLERLAGMHLKTIRQADDWLTSWRRLATNGAQTLVPVGSYPGGASSYGLLDMAGNVSEWCRDWYQADWEGRRPATNPVCEEPGLGRIVRGGGWTSNRIALRSTITTSCDPLRQAASVGFRCVRIAPGSAVKLEAQEAPSPQLPVSSSGPPDGQPIPRKPPPGEGAGKPAVVVVDARTGVIERDGAKVEFSARSQVREMRIIANPVAPINRNQIPVSPAVAFKTDRVAFEEPLRITLPYDPAKLPAGVKPESIFIVLAAGAATEQLPFKPRVAADKHTVTFELDRLVPLVDLQGAGGLGPVTVQASVNQVDLVVIDTSPEMEIRAMKTLEAEARQQMAAIKNSILQALTFYKGKGLRTPSETLSVDYVPLSPGFAAQTSGGKRIEINSNYHTTTPADVRAYQLAHECFHLVQETYEIANIKALKDQEGVEYSPLSSRWLAEGTAEWGPRGMRLIPFFYSPPKRDFGYKSLVIYDDITELAPLPHQYQASILWAYLDSLYDADSLIQKCYELFMSNRFTLVNAKEDQEYKRGSFNAVHVLDHVLKTTPDRKGRTRDLRQVYPEFLLQLYWYKGFKPLALDPGSFDFGGPRELMMPTVAVRTGDTEKQQVDARYVVPWNLPDEKEGKRLYQQSATVEGDNLAIVKMFVISSKTDQNSNERGDLKLTLKAPLGRYKSRAVSMYVFPVTSRTQDPLFGDPKNPVTIPEWETHEKALVMIIDMSEQSYGEITLTAAMKEAEKPAARRWVLAPELTPKKDFGWVDASGRRIKLEHHLDGKPGEVLQLIPAENGVSVGYRHHRDVRHMGMVLADGKLVTEVLEEDWLEICNFDPPPPEFVLGTPVTLHAKMKVSRLSDRSKPPLHLQRDGIDCRLSYFNSEQLIGDRKIRVWADGQATPPFSQLSVRRELLTETEIAIPESEKDRDRFELVQSVTIPTFDAGPRRTYVYVRAK